MVTEQHFFVGWNVVEAIVMPHRGRHPRRVNAEHGFSDIQAVETVRDQINADRGDDNPQRVYLLTPV